MSAQDRASAPSRLPATSPVTAPTAPPAAPELHPAGPSPAGHRAAAYFDLDKTILATSSTWALGTPMRRSGLISSRALAYGLIAQIPYLLVGAGTQRSSSLMEHLALMSAGISRRDLMEVVEGALATAIEPAVYAEALDLIEAHRRAGHDVVIVSGSAEEMVEPIAALVGADRSVASRMEVDGQGRFTGRISRSLLHGAKVEALEADARAHGIDLSASWAYSDSVSDLPMLQAVGHPVAVNPDRDLRRRAQEEGWPVRDFQRPVTLRRLLPSPPSCGHRMEAALSGALLVGAGAAVAWLVARRR